MKFGGAKSGTGKGHGSKGVTDSSQLKMIQFFCPEARGTPLGAARTDDIKVFWNLVCLFMTSELIRPILKRIINRNMSKFLVVILFV